MHLALVLGVFLVASCAIAMARLLHKKNLVNLRWPSISSDRRFTRYCAAYARHKGWVVAVANYNTGTEIHLSKEGKPTMTLVCRTGSIFNPIWLQEARKYEVLRTTIAVVHNGVIYPHNRQDAMQKNLYVLHFSELNQLDSLETPIRIANISRQGSPNGHQSELRSDESLTSEVVLMKTQYWSYYYRVYTSVSELLAAEANGLAEAKREDVLKLIREVVHAFEGRRA